MPHVFKLTHVDTAHRLLRSVEGATEQSLHEYSIAVSRVVFYHPCMALYAKLIQYVRELHDSY